MQETEVKKYTHNNHVSSVLRPEGRDPLTDLEVG